MEKLNNLLRAKFLTEQISDAAYDAIMEPNNQPIDPKMTIEEQLSWYKASMNEMTNHAEKAHDLTEKLERTLELIDEQYEEKK